MKVTFHLIDEKEKEIYKSDRLFDVWTFLKKMETAVPKEWFIEEKEDNKTAELCNAEYFMFLFPEEKDALIKLSLFISK
jgi:hypothetical protein